VTGRATVRVTIRLFARLREITGSGELAREVPQPGRRAGGMGRADAGIPGARAVPPGDLLRRQRAVREVRHAPHGGRRGGFSAASIGRRSGSGSGLGTRGSGGIQDQRLGVRD
jgi:hypothetical protein